MWIDNLSDKIDEILENKLPYEETLDWFKPQTEIQERAKNNIAGLAKLAIDFKWKPPKPVVFALHGKAGRGKTHLLKSFLNELAKAGLSYKYDYKPNTAMHYRVENFQIMALDDLFAGKNNVEKLEKWDYTYLENLFFDIYENKKILIFTSNFSLKELVEFIKKYDERGLLLSRISEFIWICPDIEMDGEDYRQQIWEETKDIFSGYFS